MNCPKCNHSLPDDAKFCLGCGAQVQLNCSSCQTPLPGSAQFCLSCGQPVGAQQSFAAGAAPDILGYCAGNGSAIRASDPHFKCMSCRQLYTDKFRFQDHPVCEPCAYKDGTAQQLEKELSTKREAEARAKEEQIKKEGAKRERLARKEAEAKQKPHICPVTGIEFVLVPEGEFQMGDIWGEGDNDEDSTHLVTVPAFQMAKYPVTQGQWLEVMGGENPAASSGSQFVDPDKPVINVSWGDAQSFIRRLNHKSSCNYRLPSEAEWEYAARSRSGRDMYPWTINYSSLSAHAHFYQNIVKGVTQIVGKRCPNDLELYDMSGNVLEYCEDCWHKNYEGAPKDGSAWTSSGDSSLRVSRGGSWDGVFSFCRVACRYGYGMCDRSSYLVFRLSQDSK